MEAVVRPGRRHYLQGVASRNAQLSRERAAELEAFVADDSTSVAGFLGRMATSAPNASAWCSAAGGPSATARRAARRGRVNAGERQWLDTHINADGELDAYEQALIEFLAGTRPSRTSSGCGGTAGERLRPARRLDQRGHLAVAPAATLPEAPLVDRLIQHRAEDEQALAGQFVPRVGPQLRQLAL
jgi:hypothetical protein